MYRLLIKRVRNNPLTGGVQYKVILCDEMKMYGISTYPDSKIFFMSVDRPYRVGTFINPRKALGV